MTELVVVSGATGFLGAAVCRELAAHGFAVRALARDPVAAREVQPGLEWFPGALPDGVDPGAFAGAGALVHCAWGTRLHRPGLSRAVNVDGSKRLFGLARARGARIVFVSSLSAHEEAESLYGRTKLEVEALLDLARDAVVRPGTIIGEGGVFWRQAASIAALPIVPLFYGGEQSYQTVALDDVCEGIRRLLEHGLVGRFGLAEVEPVRLRDAYAELARAVGKRPRFLRLPGGPSLLALRLAEALGFRLPISSDNLLGLKHLRPFDLAGDVQRLGVRPRTMRESMAGIRWDRIERR